MSDTRKIEEQTKEELPKEHEMSMEDLDKVAGGKNEVTPETENTEIGFSVQFDDPAK